MWRLQQLASRGQRSAKAFLENRQAIARLRAWNKLLRATGYEPNDPVRLHIGCGDINAKGFINVDARPGPHVHIVTSSLFRLAMIPPETASLIYMSHVLEHVGHRQIAATLSEMRRILRPRGVLRVSVPDFDRILEIYKATSGEIRAIQQPLMGGQDYPFNFHFSVFNERHLRSMMIKSGFASTREWNPLQCDHHDFEDWASMKIAWRDRTFPISLNLEAVK